MTRTPTGVRHLDDERRPPLAAGAFLRSNPA